MPLLEPAVERIAPPPGGEASEDRVPDSLAGGTPEPLRSELVALLGPERVRTRVLDLVRYASDASPYRLIPQAVVEARDPGDVAKVLAYGRRSGVPVTLRSGGTSLNGQAQSDGILVDVRRHFAGIELEQDGERVRVGPGTVLGHVNRALRRHARRVGPDPASTDFATVGGVIANNAGGMRCGVVADSYQTVRELTFVLPSGTLIDTGAAGAEERFAAEEPELAAGLTAIRDEIRADAELSARIQAKFEIKNTTGYRLCAFLDADSPLEIFRRLLVGSEGTLAFTAGAVMETVPFPRRTATALLMFEDLDSAAEAVPALVAEGTTATELLVATTLIAAGWNFPGALDAWKELPPESAAVLCEFRAEDEAELAAREAAALRVLEGRPLIERPDFTRDAELTELFWRVREGMHGLVGKIRPEGTALIVEDVCVRPERIAEAARDIQGLLAKHEFLVGVAGHASAGNLHFMLTPEFSKQADRERYETFMADLVELVLGKYDGSLKAEHGTGFNMAPYVEREWGAKATDLMWRIKALADPDRVLAPGVLLNRDPEVHLRNLKTTPPIEEVASTCVECGFCEPVCPSRDLTTTPRQRIVLRREMARQPSGSPVQRALIEQYEYDAIETCAADGSCYLACPVGIDTGKLVKGFRACEHSPRAERAALGVAERFGRVEKLARGAVRAGHAAPGMRGLTGAMRQVVSPELVPAWTDAMPRAASPQLPVTRRERAAAVYLPACVNRIFGHERALSLPAALVAVSERAGLPLWIPEDTPGHCCATPWASKGYSDGHAFMANKTVEALWRWSDAGELPVVTDASSCALGLVDEVVPGLSEQNAELHGKLTILDSIEWAHDHLLPGLEIPRRVGSAAVHPPCSTRHLKDDGKLATLAAAMADEVTVPRNAGCCGFAGDRGFLHPELTAAATAEQAAELAGRDFDAHLSSNRTCEIGLEQATGLPYESFVFTLEALTR